MSGEITVMDDDEEEKGIILQNQHDQIWLELINRNIMAYFLCLFLVGFWFKKGNSKHHSYFEVRKEDEETGII